MKRIFTKVFDFFFSPIQHSPHQGAINLAYRPDIDGIRALAVLSVVGFHAFPQTLKGGFIGVDIFFVISGYLISSIIVNDIENKKFSLLQFYNRRVRRIFPALIVVLISVFSFGWFALLADEFLSLGKHIFGGSAFIANIVLLKESGYFDVASQLKPLLHLWSLGIEEQFYIVFPIVLLLCAKYKFRMPTIIAILCVLSFLDNVYLYRRNPTLDFYSPLSRVWELLAGAVLSTAFRNKTVQFAYIRMDAVCAKWLREGETKNDGRNLSLILAACGIFFIGVGLLLARQGDAYPAYKAIYPIIGTLCLLAAGPANFISKHILSNRIAVFIGLISYPLYLWHWPILSYAHIIVGDLDSSTRILRVSIVFLSIILSTITYFIIERPIRFNRKKGYGIMIFLIVALTLTAALGFYTFKSGGFFNRVAMAKYDKFNSEIKAYSDGYIRDGNINGVHKVIDTLNIPWGNHKKDGWFQYRYNDVGGNTTYAIWGNSFANVAFYGFSKVLSEYGINTLFIGGWHPQYHSLLPEMIDNFDINSYAKQIQNILCNERNISKVFIINRFYKQDLEKMTQSYINSVQIFIDNLRNMGKEVYIVEQNPVLPENIRKFIPRPLNAGKRLINKRTDVEEEKKYLIPFYKKLKNVEIIRTLDLWCNKETCITYNSDDFPLYVDGSHLGHEGSILQAKFVCKKLNLFQSVDNK